MMTEGAGDSRAAGVQSGCSRSACYSRGLNYAGDIAGVQMMAGAGDGRGVTDDRGTGNSKVTGDIAVVQMIAGCR